MTIKEQAILAGIKSTVRQVLADEHAPTTESVRKAILLKCRESQAVAKSGDEYVEAVRLKNRELLEAGLR